MRYLLVIVTCLACVALPSPARADYIYTVNAVGAGSPGAPQWGVYSFSEPSILRSLTRINSANFLSSSGAALDYLYVGPTSSLCPGGGSSANRSCVEIHCVEAAQFRCGPGGSTLVFGFASELLTVGVYGTPPLTLEIAERAPVIPEPATLVLLGTGVLGLAVAVRRRLA